MKPVPQWANYLRNLHEIRPQNCWNDLNYKVFDCTPPLNVMRQLQLYFNSKFTWRSGIAKEKMAFIWFRIMPHCIFRIAFYCIRLQQSSLIKIMPPARLNEEQFGLISKRRTGHAFEHGCDIFDLHQYAICAVDPSISSMAKQAANKTVKVWMIHSWDLSNSIIHIRRLKLWSHNYFKMQELPQLAELIHIFFISLTVSQIRVSLKVLITYNQCNTTRTFCCGISRHCFFLVNP